MRLRLMRRADIPAAATMIGANFSKAFQRSGTKELYHMFGKGPILPTYIVAEDKGQVVGFGGYIQSWMDYDAYELFWINVRKDRQRQGIGTAITEKLLAIIKAKKPLLIMLSTDKPKYYKRWGFKKFLTSTDQGYTKMALSIKGKHRS